MTMLPGGSVESIVGEIISTARDMAQLALRTNVINAADFSYFAARRLCATARSILDRSGTHPPEVVALEAQLADIELSLMAPLRKPAADGDSGTDDADH